MIDKWKKSKLGTITEVITKGTTPTTIGYDFVDEGVNFIKIESIANDGTFLFNKMVHISDQCNNKMKRSQLKENDILFSIAGAIGRTAIVAQQVLPANTNQALAIIRLNTVDILPEFLLVCLNSEYIYKQFQKKKQGVAQLNISLKDISDLEVLYPSVAEQIRILNVIDKAQSLIDKRKEQIEACDELIKGLFYSMFGAPTQNNKKWYIDSIGNHFKVKTGATPSRKEKEYWEKGTIPWVKTTELKENVIMQADEKISQVAYDNSSVTLLPKETVLIAMYGQGKTRGMTGKLGIQATSNQACAAILPNDKDNQHFIWNQLRLCYEELRNLGRGGNQPNLNLDLVRGFKIIFPPIQLQNKFANQVEKIEQQKQLLEQSLTELEDNFNSLMQRAFKGELF